MNRILCGLHRSLWGARNRVFRLPTDGGEGDQDSMNGQKGQVAARLPGPTPQLTPQEGVQKLLKDIEEGRGELGE